MLIESVAAFHVDALKSYLQKKFPICSIADYINTSLFHPEHGFYLQADPLTYHFVTPSTLSAKFNEAIAEWVDAQKQEITIEYGSGSGALALALLKQIKNQPLYLVEKSEFYRKIQQQTLERYYKNIFWVEDLPLSQNAVVILQEVFDCLPAYWYRKKNGLLEEVVLDTERWQLLNQPIKKIFDSDFSSDQYMDSPAATTLLTNIYHQLHSGIVLIIDYGDRTQRLREMTQQVACPIRAYKNHEQLEKFWHIPGLCDLTYDVDFEILMKTWVSLSGSIRYYGTLAQFLLYETSFIQKGCAKAKMLLDPRFLGEAFKVLVLEKL
jgi:SAM-dependent MidA family methyltransferase